MPHSKTEDLFRVGEIPECKETVVTTTISSPSCTISYLYDFIPRRGMDIGDPLVVQGLL